MGYHRDAARLLLCTSSHLAHQANGFRSYSKLARQTARIRTTPAPSSRSLPSSQRHITNAAKRTSQQAAAAKKDDEPEEQSNDPQQEHQQRTQIAQDFLTGPSPSRQQATRIPRNPLRDTSTTTNNNNTTRPNPNPNTFSPTDIDPEISQRFSFLRDHPPPPGQSPTPTPKASEQAQESTFQTLLSTFNQHRTAQPRKSNNRANSTRMMAPPTQQKDPAGRDLVRSRAEADLSPPSFVLGVRLPRTVEVNHKRGVDLGRAFSIMDTRLRANNVKSDMFNQRFHERPGLKRKRLASTRWRRRFKDGLKETIGRILEIRSQGW